MAVESTAQACIMHALHIVSTQNDSNPCEIWRSHGSEYGDSHIVRYQAV
jgi:hypothetical protein